MNKKIFAIGSIGLFLLASMTTISAIKMFRLTIKLSRSLIGINLGMNLEKC